MVELQEMTRLMDKGKYDCITNAIARLVAEFALSTIGRILHNCTHDGLKNVNESTANSM